MDLVAPLKRHVGDNDIDDSDSHKLIAELNHIIDHGEFADQRGSIIIPHTTDNYLGRDLDLSGYCL